MADQEKKAKKPTVTKYRPGSSLPDVRRRAVFEGYDITEEYVNIFERCDNPEQLYHLIDLVLKGKIYPYAQGTLPFRCPSTAKLPEETYTVGNVLYGDWEAVPARKFLYSDARECVVRLRTAHPGWPRLPSVCGDIREGLRDIQDWCIETRQNGKATKNLSQKQWKPPNGYTGSKSIVTANNIPRSTLEGWAERHPPEKTVKDPRTQENYYPKKWLKERLKSYKARRNT
jgi:hypothetical protein